MRTNYIIALVAFTLCASPIQAQFLQKLGKKLKEQAEQFANSVKQQSTFITQGDIAAGPSDTVTIHPSYNLMRITKDTKFISIPNLSKISDMHEGMFGVVCNNYDWAFFNREGKMIFDASWRNPTGKDADVRFDNGAVIMAKKEASGRTDKLYILYKNGTKKQLPSTYARPTQFVDGVARILKRTSLQSGGTYVYINTEGKEIMPAANESVKYGLVGVERVGRLSDGLRAHYWVDSQKWGYINEQGKTVIKPIYEVARDFSEGRAVVAEQKGYSVVYTIIDTTGKVIFQTKPTTMASDCHDGMIIVSDEENGTDNIFDRNGKLLKTCKTTTPFYKGYAWASEMNPNEGTFGSSNNMIVMDTYFQRINQLPISFIERRPDNLYGFTTGESGFITIKINGRASVFLPNGTLIACSALEGSIGSMTEDLVAQVDLESYNSQKMGFVNPKGEFTILFKTEQTQLTSPTRIYDNPDNPFSPRNNKGEACPLQEEIEWTWVTPASPVTSESPEKYKITVIARPTNGGNVSGAGTYEAGQKFTVTATPAPQWEFSSLSSQELYLSTTDSIVHRIMPSKDITFIAYFKQTQPVDAPAKSGVCQGTHTFGQEGVYKDETTVYLEMSHTPTVSSPYGAKTYGFLTAILNPDKTIKANLAEIGSLKMKTFFAPMLIRGQMIENDTTYLIVEGGQMMAGGIEFNLPNDPIIQMYYSFFMDFNGRKLAALNRGRYRIQLTETASGEITLGKMERYHTELGWLPNDSKEFEAALSSIDRMMMKTNKNASIPAYLFEGVTLKPAEKRSVDWAPPASWFKDTNTATQQTEKFLKSYATYQSDCDK